MTLSYSVKKCKSYGFSQTFKNAVELFPLDYLNSKDLYIVSDTIEEDKFPKKIKKLDFEISPIPNRKHGIIFVELATVENIEINVPITHNDIDSIKEYVENNKEKFESLSNGELLECIDILENIYENDKFLHGKTMTFKFYDFVKSIYGILKDTLFKTHLLEILSESHSVSELEMLHPVIYESKKIDKVVASKLFKDIEIIIDEKNTGKSNSMYKTSKDDMKQASLGNSIQLEAFSKGMFTVIRGKKSAGITNNGDQNHDVLDIMARNGVVCTPESLRNSSLDKLMKTLAGFEEFDVVFIHPSLMYKNIRVEFPSEQGKPEYNMNEGELIAVVFRYLCLNFFGYKGIYDENQREYEFLF